MICWFEAGVTDSFGPQREAPYVGTELEAVVAAPGSLGYAVGPDGERALETRAL